MLGRMASDMMIKPGKSPVFESPADYDLPFEEVEFESTDGVTLRGWLIPGGDERVIIQSHFGVQCSRVGWTPNGKGLIKGWDRDISFLRQARHYVAEGYTVLMYDLRNHGESDAGTCSWVSWGPEEAHDVIAAVSFIAEHPRYRGAAIGLLSICMGAASTTYAYGLGEDGLAQFSNVKALVAVQPLHYANFVEAPGMPRFINRAGSAVTLRRTGLDLNTKTFMPDVAKVTVPTLVVQNSNDPWTDLEFVRQYYDSLNVEKEMLWLDLPKKRFAGYDWLGTSPEVVVAFFDKHL